MPEAPKLPDDWTEPERWAWQQIAAGKEADFNALAQETDDAEPLDPKLSDGWGADRRLRAAFIRTILTEARFVEATPFGGVRIRGALVDDEPIDLEHARLPHQFWLGESRIKTAVLGDDLRVDGGMSFRKSFVMGHLGLNGAKIDQLLSMQCASFKNVVDLTGASIGLLSMTGACFARRVSLNGATIKRSALLDRGATFMNMVDLDKNALDLIGTNIGGQLAMKGSRFVGRVSLDGANIAGPAFLDAGAKFEAKLDLTGTSIGADLVLGDADFASTVNLTNARIGAELRLGSRDQPPARWGSGALILRNTCCASLQDCWETAGEPEARSWPERIDLEGFTYDLLGGFAGSGGGPADMRTRPASSYIAWLARHRPFSPQPYEQLAKVLRASGEPGKANDILYAARERQRKGYWDVREWRKWLGLSVLKCAIGYGLGRRYFWFPLCWVALLTAIGTLLLQFCGRQPEHGWLALAFASFDQLLPAITLDRAHEKLFSAVSADGFVQEGWLIGYFYIHKLVGWMLGIFLLAGLAGLTQRS